MNRDTSSGGMGPGRRSKTVNAQRRSSVKTNGSCGESLTPSINASLSSYGKILYANRVMREYSGLSLEDVMADDFRARLVHPDDLERSRDERQHALERGTPFELELRARRKDGQYRWFLIRYNPLAGRRGTDHSLVLDGNRHRRPQTGRRENSKRKLGVARRDRSVFDV